MTCTLKQYLSSDTQREEEWRYEMAAGMLKLQVQNFWLSKKWINGIRNMEAHKQNDRWTIRMAF